jgi:catechol 2,3-dioxygenase-like lactoylglutathione lyase family enzyme
VIKFEDISHIGIEVTDLEEAERFYAGALGLQLLHRDNGELGKGRIFLRNESNQVLILEKVDRLSMRSRFSGPDRNNVPDPAGPPRYSGAHLAISVASVEEYDEIYAKLEKSAVHLEGDVLAAERKPGEKSVYFYDPSGNRLQLIILPLQR